VISVYPAEKKKESQIKIKMRILNLLKGR
jgi:hypothetical protein